jgi:NADH-quinone oxidoreductase subunit N
MNLRLDIIGPELLLGVIGIIVLIADLCVRRGDRGLLTPLIALVGLVGCFAYDVTLMAQGAQSGFADSISSDPFGAFFRVLFCLVTILVILTGVDYFRHLPSGQGEVYALLVFATMAMSLLAISSDLIMIYLSMEFVSITGYVLAGYLKSDRRSNEAALKYFLFGAVCSAMMLYGMTLLYGATGETAIRAIAARLAAAPVPVALLGLAMILIGFGFKIAMVPFHAWAPDVYEGAPTPFAAFFSAGPKLAGFAVLVRVLQTGFPGVLHVKWVHLIAVLAAATMTVGNVGALRQTNIKRMLAYSSIAQAGYMLIGVAAFATAGVGLAPLLYYALAYVFMNLGAFGVAIIVELNVGSAEIPRWAGLSQRGPVLALIMAVFLLSLAGIPPTAGFFGKLYLFLAAIGSPNLWWLAVVGVANAVVSLYYYANVIRTMYFVEAADGGPVEVRLPAALGVGACLALTLLLAILAMPFLDLINASQQILSIP